MAITYKDINQLTQKSSVAGTEKLPVSDTEYITPSQIGIDSTLVPNLDNLTPTRTIEYDRSAGGWFTFLTRANTGLTGVDDLNDRLVFRITITGTDIKHVMDCLMIFRPQIGVSPALYYWCHTISTAAATTGIYYFRTIYPKELNSGYTWRLDGYVYNATARHIKVEVFEDTSAITWATSASTSSTYDANYETSLGNHGTTVNGFRSLLTMDVTVNSANAASYLSAYLPVFPGNGNVFSAGEALTSGVMGFLSTDKKIHSISNTTDPINVDSGIYMIGAAYSADAGIPYAYIRDKGTSTTFAASGASSYGTFARGDEVFLRCTLSNGQIYSDSYLSPTTASGYTWVSIGIAQSATAFAYTTIGKDFFTLDSNGKLTHVNGKEIKTGSFTQVQSDWNQSNSSAVDYIKNKPNVTSLDSDGFLEVDYDGSGIRGFYGAGDYLYYALGTGNANSSADKVLATTDQLQVLLVDFNEESAGNTGNMPSGTFNALLAQYTNGLPCVVRFRWDDDGETIYSRDYFVSYIADGAIVYQDDYITLSSCPDEGGARSYFQINPNDTFDHGYGQFENKNNRVQAIGSYTSDQTKYPSTKAVHDYIGSLKTDNTTAQSTSSSEKLTGTINLHKIAKTGTYSDLLNKPDVAQILGSYSVPAGKILYGSFGSTGNHLPQVFLVISNGSGPTCILSIAQYASGDNLFYAIDITGASDYLYKTNGKAYLYQDGSRFAIRAGSSGIYVEVVALYKNMTSMNGAVDDWDEAWTEQGYDPIEIPRLATVSQLDGYLPLVEGGTITRVVTPSVGASYTASVAIDGTNMVITGPKMNNVQGTTEYNYDNIVLNRYTAVAHTPVSYTLAYPLKDGTLATTGDIPDTSGFLPLAGGTMDDEATLTFDGQSDGTDIYSGVVETYGSETGAYMDGPYATIGVFDNSSGDYKQARLGVESIQVGVDDETIYTQTFPLKSGTFAMTSDIPSAPGTLNTTATTAQSTSASEALSGSITLHKVAKTGTYSDLIGTPTIPTVPTISTNVQTDKASDTKTSSPKSVYDEVHPAVASSQPNGGFVANIFYNLGTITGTVTFALASATDNTIVNHYYWTFDTSSTAPTITWPSGVSWVGGSAPTISASKHYEISILNNIGTYMEV